MIPPTFDILTGRSDGHVDSVAGTKFRLHRDVLGAFDRLVREAASDGFQIELASSFRDFATQLRIWNDKAEGKRALLDRTGNPLTFSSLSPEAIVPAILRWSALPGASRHHWGTDFDIYPTGLGPSNYKVQLVPQEIAVGGPYEEFGEWLDDRLPLFGFFRPYGTDRGGVSPEWWHLSYGPIAQTYQKAYTLETLRQSVAASDLKLKPIVESQLEAIFKTYIDNVATP